MRQHFIRFILVGLIVGGSAYACPDHDKPDKKQSSEAAKQSPSVGMRAKDIWARASSGKTSAVYLTLQNTQTFDDELVGVDTAVCERVEIHETREEEGVYSMHPVESLPIKAGESQQQKSGGHHIMLLDLKKPLKKEEKIPLTLIFSNAPAITLEAPVSPRDPTFPADDEEGGCDCKHDVDKKHGG